MKKYLVIFLSLGFAYVGLAFIFGRVNLDVRSRVLTSIKPRKFYDYSGVINVHSSRTSSESAGSYDAIHQSASDTNLKFVIISDSNDFSPPNHLEAYYNDTLLLFGGEYSFFDSRLINLNYQNLEHLRGPGHSQVIFSDLLEADKPDPQYGFFVLTHPFKSGYKIPNPIPQGLLGMEVYNLKAIWSRAWLKQKLSFFWAMLIYPINIQWSFARLFAAYPAPEFGLWDQVNQTRKMVGFAGTDADAYTNLPWGQWEFPSFQTYFTILRNHILIQSELTGKVESDRRKILEALQNGQFYMSLDLIGNPEGFEAYIVDANNRILPMGSTVDIEDTKHLVVDLASKPQAEFRVLIYKNGEKIISSNSLHTELVLPGPGAYRSLVQVKLSFPLEGRRWVNWIMTNHFYVNSKSERTY